MWRSAWTSWCGPCCSWRAAADPRPAGPGLLQAPVPAELVEGLLVLDLPGRRPLLEVLDPAAHLGVQLVVDHHVTLEHVGHPLPQHGVLGEDLLDVRRLHER